MVAWLVAIALASAALGLTFYFGMVYERGTAEPEPCRRRHADELK